MGAGASGYNTISQGSYTHVGAGHRAMIEASQGSHTPVGAGPRAMIPPPRARTLAYVPGTCDNYSQSTVCIISSLCPNIKR